jgi:hypothetical protein
MSVQQKKIMVPIVILIFTVRSVKIFLKKKIYSEEEAMVTDKKGNTSKAAGVATLVLFFLLTASVSHAELAAVSGFNIDNTEVAPITAPAVDVAYSLSHGFPIWYQDSAGLKLELCLDRNVETAPGVFVDPCLIENTPSLPVSFPGNFGNEAFWWSGLTFGTFDSRQDGVQVAGGDALLVQALEAAFSLGPADGEQIAFGRIRLRVSVPVTGTYLIEHPYGSREYIVSDAGRRAINQTQDIGNFLAPGSPPAGDFTLALFDGLAPVVPVPFDPSINAGIVNEDGRSIGPFLVPADAPDGAALAPITALDGRQYLALPGTELIPILQPVIGAPGGNFNGLRITLTDPDPGFCLNADPDPLTGEDCNTVVFDQFQVMGKIFNDGPNLRPTAVADVVATGKNQALRVNVAANDLDVVDDPLTGNNIHGINPQAIGLPVDQRPDADLRAGILLTRSLATLQGGTVRRLTTLNTGETVLNYTPPVNFVGTDSFFYVIQDTGGLVSAPTQVTVTVEDLAVGAARYRTRTGRWQISGTSSNTAANTVTLSLGPRTGLSGAAEVPPVNTEASGNATLRLGAESIAFHLQVDPLPSTAVTQAHIHLGGPADNGPIIFFLYDGSLEPPFTGVKTGTLANLNLIPRPAQGVNTFADALSAISEGRAYVNVHTAANSAGEIRGQLGLVPLGSAEVGQDGAWSFTGKSAVSPGGGQRSVNVESANGVQTLGVPLTVR